MLKSTVVVIDDKSESIFACDLKTGELARATDNYRGDYVWCTHDSIVNLNNPHLTWDRHFCKLLVVRVPKATVTLTFGSGS